MNIIEIETVMSLQAAFVGQKMGVRLEMVIDCGAGLYDGDEHKIY